MATSGTVIAQCTQGGLEEGARTSARYLSCMAMQSDVRLSRAINMLANKIAMFLKTLPCCTLLLHGTLHETNPVLPYDIHMTLHC